MSEPVSLLFSQLAELASAEGDVPDDGSGIGGVWTTIVPARARERDWKIAMNADTETERTVEDFPAEGDDATIRAASATVWLGRWPAGVLGPFGGQLLVEQLDAGPQSIEDELIDDVSARIDALESEGDLVTDGGTSGDGTERNDHDYDVDKRSAHIRVEVLGQEYTDVVRVCEQFPDLPDGITVYVEHVDAIDLKQNCGRGLYEKYGVYKNGESVDECFVLEPESDPAARQALLAYSYATDNNELAWDLREWVERYMDTDTDQEGDDAE